MKSFMILFGQEDDSLVRCLRAGESVRACASMFTDLSSNSNFESPVRVRVRLTDANPISVSVRAHARTQSQRARMHAR